MVPNDTIHGACSWRSARHAVCHHAFHTGFVEAMSGKPFDYAALDAMTEYEQHRYENGRELAWECRQARLTIRWTRRDAVPRALRDFITSRALRRRAGLPRTDPYRAR
jgi:hypothetical protein